MTQGPLALGGGSASIWKGPEVATDWDMGAGGDDGDEMFLFSEEPDEQGLMHQLHQVRAARGATSGLPTPATWSTQRLVDGSGGKRQRRFLAPGGGNAQD